MTPQTVKLASRVARIKPSITLEMATKAAEMRSQGIDVINFSVGEPDFNTPEHIISAGKAAMDAGFTKYTAGPGMIELRQAICEKLKRENGLVYTPRTDKPYTGKVLDLYANGKKMMEGAYKDGLMDEIWTYYYRSEERRVGKECRSRWSP